MTFAVAVAVALTAFPGVVADHTSAIRFRRCIPSIRASIPSIAFNPFRRSLHSTHPGILPITFHPFSRPLNPYFRHPFRRCIPAFHPADHSSYPYLRHIFRRCIPFIQLSFPSHTIHPASRSHTRLTNYLCAPVSIRLSTPGRSRGLTAAPSRSLRKHIFSG